MRAALGRQALDVMDPSTPASLQALVAKNVETDGRVIREAYLHLE